MRRTQVAARASSVVAAMQRVGPTECRRRQAAVRTLIHQSCRIAEDLIVKICVWHFQLGVLPLPKQDQEASQYHSSYYGGTAGRHTIYEVQLCHFVHPQSLAPAARRSRMHKSIAEARVRQILASLLKLRNVTAVARHPRGCPIELAPAPLLLG
jgi:hypothetical protein